VPITPEQADVLVQRVRDGDQQAWDALVDAYAGLVWGIARNHRLGQSDAADVSQTTWMRLVENVERIDDPRRVGAWLATTARRECLRVLRLSGRQVLVQDESDLDRGDPEEVPVDALLLRAEQAAAVRLAFDRLPERCQQLLRLLMVDTPPSYEELSAALAMPIGSIGPTRGRCLDKLRLLMEQDVFPATDDAVRRAAPSPPRT
jgi:RNA polymerase sigma factor (sigma-70 family)